MANLCSIHQDYHPDCKLCNTKPEDVFPNWEEKLAEAKKAGEHRCEACGFVFYLTTMICPKCYHIYRPQ